MQKQSFVNAILRVLKVIKFWVRFHAHGFVVFQGHRGIPIIIPEAAKKGLEYITNTNVGRRVGMADNSTYLFATTGMISFL